MAGFTVVASHVLTNSHSFQLMMANTSVQEPDLTYKPARFGYWVEGSDKKASQRNREFGCIEQGFLGKLLFMGNVTIVVWPVYLPGNEHGPQAYKGWPSTA